MSNTAPETSHSNYMLSILGALGSILLFGLIVLIAYVYMFDPEPVNQQRIDQRLTIRGEVDAKQKALTTEYAVVNADEGTVRIPTELAMQLVVKKNQENPDGIFPATIEAAPAPATPSEKSEDKSDEAAETADNSEPTEADPATGEKEASAKPASEAK